MYKMVFSPFAQEPCNANGGKTTKLSITGRVYCSRWGRGRGRLNTGTRRERGGNEAGRKKNCPWMCCSHWRRKLTSLLGNSCSHGGSLTRSRGSEEILIRKEGPRLGHLLCVASQLEFIGLQHTLGVHLCPTTRACGGESHDALPQPLIFFFYDRKRATIEASRWTCVLPDSWEH